MDRVSSSGSSGSNCGIVCSCSGQDVQRVAAACSRAEAADARGDSTAALGLYSAAIDALLGLSAGARAAGGEEEEEEEERVAERCDARVAQYLVRCEQLEVAASSSAHVDALLDRLARCLQQQQQQQPGESAMFPAVPERRAMTAQRNAGNPVVPMAHHGFRPTVHATGPSHGQQPLNRSVPSGPLAPMSSQSAPPRTSQGGGKPYYFPYTPGPLVQRQAANMEADLAGLGRGNGGNGGNAGAAPPQPAGPHDFARDFGAREDVPRGHSWGGGGARDEEEAAARAAAAQAALQPLRILAIDSGGGAAAALPLFLVAELEKRTGQKCSQLFDLVVGVGSGGVVALSLTKPVAPPAAELAKTFVDKCWELGQRVADKDARMEESNAALEAALKAVIPDSSMRACLANTAVVLFDERRGEPAIVRSWDAQTSSFPVPVVARASSASPGVFAPVDYDGQVLLDGSVAGSNASLTAWAEARRLHPTSANFLIVSLGCGPVGTRPPEDPLLKLVAVLANAPARQADRNMRVLLGGNYVRLDAEKPLDRARPDEVRREAAEIAAVFGGTLDSVVHRLVRPKQQH
eukprot:m51a1_g8813 hypothetical protein (577) ;mRNA; r:298231-300809